MKVKTALLMAGAALLPCNVAMAQTASPPEAENASDDADGTEIIVTAQRREQSLQDVPVAVSVVSGSALERQNIRSLTEITARLPNVKVAQGNSTDFLAIRGVASGGNLGFEQSVGTFLDGVYRGRARATRAAIFDVERIEVLRGPQTLFFGNNAIAGALSITSRKPGNEFKYNTNLLYAPSDGEYVAEVGVTVPVSPTFSVRGAVRASGMDGYVENKFLSQDGPHLREYQGRVSARWEPSSDFRSDLRFDIFQSRSDNASPREFLNCPAPAAYGAPRGACASYLAAMGPNADDDLNYVASTPPSTLDYDMHELAWTNSLQVGDLTLSSITGYFHHQWQSLLQGVPSPVPGIAGFPQQPNRNDENYSQFSQELRLQSPTGGTFEYMVGTYYANADLKNIYVGGLYFAGLGALAPGSYTAADPIAVRIRGKEDQTTLSAFGSLTIRPVETLRINLGVRYTNVKKDAIRAFEFGTAGRDVALGSFVLGPPAAQTQLNAALNAVLGPYPTPSRTDDAWQPSIGVQYDITSDVMAYANYRRGFKAGGYDQSAAASVFGPETVNSYEIGVKGVFFDRALTLNTALFRGDYKDLQEGTFAISPAGIFIPVVRNAAAVRSQGVEVSSELRLAPNFSLRADVAYLDSKYQSYPLGACTGLQQITIPGCKQNMSGKPLAYAPKFSGNVGFHLSVPVGKFELVADPSVYFTSRFFQQATADPLLEQPAYAKIDLRIGIKPSEGNWELAVIGQNLTSKVTSTYRSLVTTTAGGVYATPDRPRSVAIQFTFRN